MNKTFVDNMWISYISRFIFLFFLLIPFLTQANGMYRFRRFSPEGGFYYNGVHSIRQDNSGFIWFLLDNGLYRFDGYEYKNYQADFSNLQNHKIRTRQFHCLLCDQSGNILVGTFNGLYQYDYAGDSFEKIMDSEVSGLYMDHHNYLWMNKEGRLLKYVLKEGEYKESGYYGKTVQSARHHVDNDRFLFFSSGPEIFRYDHETNQLDSFFSFPADKTVESLSLLYNKLWVLVAGEVLYSIDISTVTIENRYDFFHRTEGGTVLARTIHIDKKGYIWIATQQGLYILDPTTGKHTHHQYSDTDPFSLPNNSVWTFGEDRERNIWIGTFAGGLCYVNLDEALWLKSITPKQNPLSHYLVSGFAEDDRNLWIATEGGGINRMNKQTREIDWFMYQEDQNSLSYDHAKSLVFDSKKRLWIATFRGGLNCYDTRTKRFTHFRHDPENENSLYSDDLRKILPEGDSGIWISYQSNDPVLSFYSFQEERFTHYRLSEKSDFTYDVCRDNNSIWLISEQLYKFDIAQKSVRIFRPDSLFLNGQTLCVDKNDDIWIGTVGQGLIRFDTQKEEFRLHRELLDKNFYSVLSICTDDKNNLWLGTDNGLIYYDPLTNRSLRFDRNDGAQGNQYYPNATFCSESGELYFGGANGFTVVRPNLLRRNLYQPEVMFCDFYLDHVPVSFPVSRKSRNRTKAIPDEIELNHTQTNFGFSFSSDNYLSPEKNRFRYRLKGYDDQWKETGAGNRHVLYTRVPPGNYTFEIMAANNDEVWNETVKTIRIRRLPPPWLSGYAYLLYSVVSLLLIILIIRHFHRQKKLKMQLYLEAVDKEKKEELYQSQLQFFTNISHDFRTPLFLIIAVLDKLREGGWKEDYYRLLHSNANRLLSLVNELMDFRTIENGKMKLQVSSVDINRIVYAISDDFRNYALQNRINFEISCDDRLPVSLCADEKILEKILMNLLNNAFKYTPESGSVRIETHYGQDGFCSPYPNSFTVGEKTDPANSFLIVVRDTGIGISKSSIRQVFERFYKVEDHTTASHLGSGIGLALVKSLVLLHKGNITLYSKREIGSDIVICLPTDPAVYASSEWLPREAPVKPKEEPVEKQTPLSAGLPIGEEEILPAANKIKILLVEDNHDLRTLIAGSLEQEFDVIEAADGEIAMRILNKKRVDLIISDIMMPVKDGISLCQDVKNNRDLSHIPFVILTAKTTLESKLQGMVTGADLYFEKPVDSRLLKATLHNMFRNRKKLQEHYARNYYADSKELSNNEQDQEFLRRFIDLIDQNLDKPQLDINFIASELYISRAKLYNKVKSLTNRSTVEFILNYRLRKAARLLLQENQTVRQIMERVGIESASYFSSAFKKEFGETPTAFIKRHKSIDV